jgi:hypothetical protein
MGLRGETKENVRPRPTKWPANGILVGPTRLLRSVAATAQGGITGLTLPTRSQLPRIKRDNFEVPDPGRILEFRTTPPPVGRPRPYPLLYRSGALAPLLATRSRKKFAHFWLTGPPRGGSFYRQISSMASGDARRALMLNMNCMHLGAWNMGGEWLDCIEAKRQGLFISESYLCPHCKVRARLEQGQALYEALVKHWIREHIKCSEGEVKLICEQIVAVGNRNRFQEMEWWIASLPPERISSKHFADHIDEIRALYPDTQ